jgi:hypothetical protein
MVLTPRFIRCDEVCQLPFKEGDLVQLYNGKETVWSRILDVKARDYFDGIVSSRPLLTEGYVFGDVIRFHRRYIQGYAIPA